MSTTTPIPRETVEKLETVITADIDPTGDTVEFAFAINPARPTTWVAGTWTSTYASGRATATTPTIGATDSGADIELAPSTTYRAFVRVTDSPEIPVRKCGAVHLT